MKNILAIFFLSLYLVALLKPVSPFIEYAINKDYIAAFLCENKASPELYCHGKCYLNKQLKKAGREEQNSNKSSLIDINDYPIGFVNIFRLDPLNAYSEINKATGYLLWSFHFIASVFHPPKAV